MHSSRVTHYHDYIIGAVTKCFITYVTISIIEPPKWKYGLELEEFNSSYIKHAFNFQIIDFNIIFANCKNEASNYIFKFILI